jgi:hypothetical protein
MYHVTLIYSPPQPLVTGEATEYCGLNCLWRPEDTDFSEPYWVRTFLNVEEPSTIAFMTAIDNAERMNGTKVPKEIRSVLWEWFLDNIDYDGREIRTSMIQVGEA